MDEENEKRIKCPFCGCDAVMVRQGPNKWKLSCYSGSWNCPSMNGVCTLDTEATNILIRRTV